MTKLYKKILFAFLGLAFTGGMIAQTAVPSIINSNQVWTPAGSPYIIGQNTLVKNGFSVEVKPGTVIKSPGAYRIIVEGVFRAEGTFDSVIVIDTAMFEFNQVSGGYNFKNGQGSTFNYCKFTGRSYGGENTIKLNSVSMLISNCAFKNTYYTVYQTTGAYDTTLVRIVRSSFTSDNGYGYATSISGMYSHLEMDECFIKGMCGLMVPANFKMTRSTVIGQMCFNAIRIMNGSRMYRGNTYIRCNTFKNFKGGVFEAYFLDSFNTIDLTNNTFDSADFFLGLYAGSITNTANLSMNKNNFLFSRQYDVKFSASSTAGVYKTYDLTDNYWGSTDTNDIKASIYDYADDITVAALVDWSNYRSSVNYVCSEEFLKVNKLSVARVSLYPNPANSLLNVDFETEAERSIRIYDMMGQLVYESKVSDTHTEINISDLANGNYVVTVVSDDMTKVAGKISIAH